MPHKGLKVKSKGPDGWQGLKESLGFYRPVTREGQFGRENRHSRVGDDGHRSAAGAVMWTGTSTQATAGKCCGLFEFSDFVLCLAINIPCPATKVKRAVKHIGINHPSCVVE
jgi:hypothetical protein